MKFKIKVAVFITVAVLSIIFIIIPAYEIHMKNVKNQELMAEQKVEKVKQETKLKAVEKNKAEKEKEDKEKAEDAEYEAGLKLFNDKRYYDAINSLNELVKKDDNYYKAHNIIGLSYCYINKYNESMAEIDKALSIKPDFSSALMSKGMCYENFGKYNEAIDSFKKALQLEDIPYCYYGMAGSYASLQNKGEALNNLKIAISKDPSFKDRAKNDKEDNFVSLKNDKDFQELLK